MVVPDAVVWSVGVALGGWMLTTAGALIHLHDRVKHKQDKERCLQEHGDLKLELLAMSKDVQAIAERQGITPARRPSDADAE